MKSKLSNLISKYRDKLAFIEIEKDIAIEAIQNFNKGRNSVMFFDKKDAEQSLRIALAKAPIIAEIINDLSIESTLI